MPVLVRNRDRARPVSDRRPITRSAPTAASATFAGLATVDPDFVWAKLAAISEGARLASGRLWKRQAAALSPVIQP